MTTIARLLKSLHNRGESALSRVRGVATRIGYGGAIRAGSTLQLGAGVRLDLYGDLVLGANVKLSDGCNLVVGPGAELRIDDGVFVGRHTVIVANRSIRIGAGTDIAEHCTIRDADHALDAEERRAGGAHFAPVVIGEGCWLGAGVRVLRGTELGAGVVVGANAVVRGTFEPAVLIAGVPARIIKRL